MSLIDEIRAAIAADVNVISHKIRQAAGQAHDEFTITIKRKRDESGNVDNGAAASEADRGAGSGADETGCDDHHPFCGSEEA